MTVANFAGFFVSGVVSPYSFATEPLAHGKLDYYKTKHC